ncbi:hypothetical protein JCM6882_001166 [Rhodosporidiobolus microsporus]
MPANPRPPAVGPSIIYERNGTRIEWIPVDPALNPFRDVPDDLNFPTYHRPRSAPQETIAQPHFPPPSSTAAASVALAPQQPAPALLPTAAGRLPSQSAGKGAQIPQPANIPQSVFQETTAPASARASGLAPSQTVTLQQNAAAGPTLVSSGLSSPHGAALNVSCSALNILSPAALSDPFSSSAPAVLALDPARSLHSPRPLEKEEAAVEQPAVEELAVEEFAVEEPAVAAEETESEEETDPEEPGAASPSEGARERRSKRLGK